MSGAVSHGMDRGNLPRDYPTATGWINPEILDGVTTGFLTISEKSIRSMIDRLGKAARKAGQGEAPAAWLMVGRIQSELTALLPEDES